MGILRQKAGRWRDRYAERGLAGIETGSLRPGRKHRIDDGQSPTKGPLTNVKPARRAPDKL